MAFNRALAKDQELGLVRRSRDSINSTLLVELQNKETMFSHVVIFWTDPKNPKAADELIEGANRYLKVIPGILHYHIGRMATSHRPVVDRTYGTYRTYTSYRSNETTHKEP